MTPNITLASLSIAALPMLPVVACLIYWRLNYANALYSIVRMLGQLLVIGYLLAFIFETEYLAVILIVLTVMVLASSWISLNSVAEMRGTLYGYALISICAAGSLNLLVMTQGVLDLTPWYSPRFLLPLAGMIFSGAMNSVSLAAERVTSELAQGNGFSVARNLAFNTSLIPITNSMLAVGLVALPGMMTGQILGGVSPLIAVRYQIMVMCMLFGTAGLASACFLVISKGRLMAAARTPPPTDARG